MAFWAGIGSFIYPAPATKSIPLQLSTLNCTLANSTEALITAAPTLAPERYFSYCYHLSLCFPKCAPPQPAAGVQAVLPGQAGSADWCQMTHQLHHELRFCWLSQATAQMQLLLITSCFFTSSQASAGRHLVLPVLPVLQCNRLRGLCHHWAVDKLYNRLVA